MMSKHDQISTCMHLVWLKSAAWADRLCSYVASKLDHDVAQSKCTILQVPSLSKKEKGYNFLVLYSSK